MKLKILLFLASLLLCAQAWAVPAFVQDTSNCNFFGASSTTVTLGGSSATACPTLTGWTSNVTAGNALVGLVWRKAGSGTLSTVSDGGDTCAVINSAGMPSTGTAGTSNGQLVYGWYCQNLAGGNKPTITLTFTVSENFDYEVAHEVSGVATSSPLDGSCARGMGATGAGTNAATTGNCSTSNNGDYVMGGMIDDGGGGTTTFVSGTTSQVWTTRLPLDNTHSESMITEDGVQTTASGSTVIAFSWSAGGTNPLLGMIALKVAGAAIIPGMSTLPKTTSLPKVVKF